MWRMCVARVVDARVLTSQHVGKLIETSNSSQADDGKKVFSELHPVDLSQGFSPTHSALELGKFCGLVGSFPAIILNPLGKAWVFAPLSQM